MRYLSGGESHGPCLTAIIEGLPAGLLIKSTDINKHLERRQKGYGRGGRMAIEKDSIKILSGLRFNKTIGSPLTLQITNRDWKNWESLMASEGTAPEDLVHLTCPRPGHADLAGGLKYDHEDLRLVLERSSARETAIRVAVGSVGRILLEKFNVKIFSHVVRIGLIKGKTNSSDIPALANKIEASPLRCADDEAEKDMISAIEESRENGDTLGGVFELVIIGLPSGLGSHVHWDRRLDGRLAGALMSIQGIKGIEVGLGFQSAAEPGSKVHDPIKKAPGTGIIRNSNRAGGLEGGISNGQPLVLRAAMKPIPTMSQPLPSIDWVSGEEVKGATERSDICAVPAAAVVAEAAAAWELALAFREKFAGDYMEEVEASYDFYMDRVRKRLHVES
ncbi:MAG: chorismate synthase [Bacillota bacterium]